jgi:methenyltetrahydrofolate cyclohydrolase
MADPRIPSNTSIGDFLAALGAADQSHGAVSASAVAAGMGTSLLLMVAAFPQTKSDSVDDRTALMGAAAALGGLREQLVETIETETAVKLFAARHMPQGSETQRSRREAAIEFALQAAADVPLEVMRLCALALEHAQTVAERGCRAASSDTELAVALILVGFNGARLNLETKLSILTDGVYTETVVNEIARLTQQTTAAARAAESSVRVPPA